MKRSHTHERGSGLLGNTDRVARDYFADPYRFASVFNYLFRKTHLKVLPESLSEVDPHEVLVWDENKGNKSTVKSDERIRDVAKMLTMCDNNAMYNILLGLGEQTYVDYRMPVRCAELDLRYYWQQINKRRAELKDAMSRGKVSLKGGEFLSKFLKTDKLTPVITVVVDLNKDKEDEWDGHESIHDMLAPMDKRLMSFVPDYKINLITPKNMSDKDINSMPCDIGLLFNALKKAHNRSDLRKMVTDDSRYQMVDTPTARLMSAIYQYTPPSSEKEVTNVAEDINGMFEDGRREGQLNMVDAIEAVRQVMRTEGVGPEDAAARVGLDPDMTELVVVAFG